MAVSESEVIELSDGTWLINGNCFTKVFCNDDEKIAKQYAKTLVNCFGCVDCVNCVNCNQCVRCRHCKDCNYCQDSSFCSVCNHSFNVSWQNGYNIPILLPPLIPIPPQPIMQQPMSQQMMLTPFTQTN